ncbi:hypothetical protein [Sagittula sp. S175]|uniref:hypothetical protein n=1 Tax=Sagittula sp. S175 TaxID=3415129 RepID=UPI003C7CBF29
MNQIAPYLSRLPPALRRATLLWDSWRDAPGMTPPFSRMQLGEITDLGLAVSISEALRSDPDRDVEDFVVIYLSPRVRGLGLDKAEGKRLSERPHTRPGSPTFEASRAAVQSGMAQFFDASGDKGILGYRSLLGVALPLRGNEGATDFAMTVVDFEL